MKKTLSSEGVDVLLVEESDSIKLPPYKNGFIGGAAGVYENSVYFIGNLKSHPNAKEIESSLNSRGFSAISLDPECDSLFDLGGILFTSYEED